MARRAYGRYGQELLAAGIRAVQLGLVPFGHATLALVAYAVVVSLARAGLPRGRRARRDAR